MFTQQGFSTISNMIPIKSVLSMLFLKAQFFSHSCKPARNEISIQDLYHKADIFHNFNYFGNKISTQCAFHSAIIFQCFPLSKYFFNANHSLNIQLAPSVHFIPAKFSKILATKLEAMCFLEQLKNLLMKWVKGGGGIHFFQINNRSKHSQQFTT